MNINDYSELYCKAIISEDKRGPCILRAKHILHYEKLYKEVSALTKVPWDVIACIHSLESDLNLLRHFHNGDLLTARTEHHPVGRPVKGEPPFTWTDSAVDALSLVPKPLLWTLDLKLHFLESYNGLGYIKKGINSPYLWAGTNLYTKGKFVRDGVFDPEAVSKQLGAVALMKTLDELQRKRE
jgi:lysozyme family protein